MATNARDDIIEDLRRRIRHIEKRGPATTSFIASGWERVDVLLPGKGFPRGALSELSGGRASGKTAIALSTLASSTRDRGLAAFVDGRHELYPPAAAALGVDLDRLLLVRPGPEGAVEAARAGLWAAEALLASGAFDVVAIDVPLERSAGQSLGSAGADAMMRRLRAAAEKGGSVGLWLGVPGAVRVPSAVRLELCSSGAGWQVRRVYARGADHAVPVTDRTARVGPTVVAVHHAA